MKRLWMNQVVMGLLLAGIGTVMAAEFGVDGEIRMRYYHRGELQKETNYNFSAEIRDANSRIRVSGGAYQLNEFHEFGWDTKSSYILVKFWTNRVVTEVYRSQGGRTTQEKLDKPVKPLNDATLNIYLSDFPPYGYGVDPVWLAYGSKSHYEARTSGTGVEPIFFMGPDVREKNVKFTSSWRMNSEPPGLLEYMTDFRNGKGYETTGNEPVIVNLPKPFDGETTNAVYRVLSWTNAFGLTLPQVFQVVRYVPDFDAPSGPALAIQSVYEGTAFSVRPVCAATTFAAQVPDSAPVRVVDARFSKDPEPVSKVVYVSKSGKVVQDLDELKKTQAYARAQEVERATAPHGPRPSKVRPLMIGLFVVASIIPVWLLFRGNRKFNQPG